MVDIGGIMIKLPLVGPAYKMQSQSISCQNCINWYPQTIEYPNGSRVAALMPTPGLKKLFTGDVAATRCLFVLSNGALLTVIGKKLYHSKANKLDLKEIGLISALGTVRIADNGQVALIVNGTYTYALDLKKLTLTRLSGSTIPRSTHVLFLDGRFVVNKANTGQFYWSDLYSTKVNALSYATAESTPDNITAIVTFNRELWLFGAQSVERYYGTGSSNSPFSRLSGGAMAFGCLAPDSIVSLATGVIWLGVSEFGGNQIVMSGGGIPDRISTHALEEEISSFTKTSDASAYAYQIEGHVFYVISFPSANVTYCFDVSTGLWHQRSFTNAQGLHERHRSQHHAYFNNMHIVGDYRNGKLYQLDNNTFTDDGELILRERTAQAVITDKKLTRFSKLEIVCETGFYGGVKKDDSVNPPISCAGAITTVTLTKFSNQGKYSFYINDHLVLDLSMPFYSPDNKTFTQVLADLDVRLELLNSDYTEALPDENGNVYGEMIRLTNYSKVDIRIRIDIDTNDPNDVPEQLDSFNITVSIHDRIPSGNGVRVLFCLAPDINACVALPPANFNLDKTLYKLDKNKEYFLYYKDVEGNLQQNRVYPSVRVGDDEFVFSIKDFPDLDGFYINYDSETETAPETCKEHVYEGHYYVKQLVQYWENDHFVGAFYVEVNGERNYLQNSSTNFPHKGTSTTLRELLKPYYEDIAQFLRSFGVDAVYDPVYWGSYNTGGILIKLTQVQYDTIKFRTDTGYSLMLDGYTPSTCISFTSFEELENGPSDLSISPFIEGELGKTEYTLLGRYNPPEQNRSNILGILGITRDINIASCFKNMPA